MHRKLLSTFHVSCSSSATKTSNKIHNKEVESKQRVLLRSSAGNGHDVCRWRNKKQIKKLKTLATKFTLHTFAKRLNRRHCNQAGGRIAITTCFKSNFPKTAHYSLRRPKRPQNCSIKLRTAAPFRIYHGILTGTTISQNVIKL